MASRAYSIYLLVLACPSGLAVPSFAQSQPAPAHELPETIRGALSGTQDFAFNYDQPGFYAVMEFVKHSDRSPGFAQPPLVVEDWRDLVQRPSEFRGRPVTITGVVGRNKDSYTLPNHPHLGQLWQIELFQPRQPVACTVILTNRASDVPLGATITVTGYFVMIHQYYGQSGRAAQAALIIAPGPTGIEQRALVATTQTEWYWIVGAAVLGLIVTIILLRRSAATAPRRDLHSLRASRDAPMNLSDDLANWAERESPDDR